MNELAKILLSTTWILWAQYSPAGTLARPWRIVAAYETRAECERNTQGGAVIARAAAGGPDLVFFLCLPDTVRPS